MNNYLQFHFHSLTDVVNAFVILLEFIGSVRKHSALFLGYDII